MKRKILILSAIVIITGILSSFNNPPDDIKIKEQMIISPVWSAHPVDFDIFTDNNHQYVVFYDSARIMTVAQRNLDDTTWNFTKLPSITGWDSHNYVTIISDSKGYIHISGNMHVSPLLYFRSDLPGDISNFNGYKMTMKNEDRVTYPVFFKDMNNQLYFQYRDGGSGGGNTIWNKYDAETQNWSRLTDIGMFDGEGEVNAYSRGPYMGTDGYFHIIWMWRETPVANTNHNLSYIRSKDLIHWESVDREIVTVPVKRQQHNLIVDPVGPWNGLINMSFNIGWDSQKKPVLTYHKYDSKGISQIYNARRENNHWKISQASSWEDFTWELNLRGSLNLEVGAEAIKPSGKGRLLQEFTHKKYGNGHFVIDEKNLKTIKVNYFPVSKIIDKLKTAENNNMEVHLKYDNTGFYLLRWETLSRNFDQPRQPPFPPPTMLKVYQIEK